MSNFKTTKKMKRKMFIMVSAFLLTIAGSLSSTAGTNGRPGITVETPSYANMRPLESMSASEAIAVMKSQYYFQEEYWSAPWVVSDNYVFDNCNRSEWTFLFVNSHYQWAVRDRGNGKCQIEPYHEWFENLDFEYWFYNNLPSQLCHIVIDYGEYYDGYTPSTYSDPSTLDYGETFQFRRDLVGQDWLDVPDAFSPRR